MSTTSAEVRAFLAAPPHWGVRGRPGTETPRESVIATLHELRDARFHGGLCCAHCQGMRVQRWGTFAGRQRYRCRDCGRTFSDLTLTPLAYSKRPELWKRFAGCMLESLSVRACGRRLGIDKNTAWRWRHALLAGHRGLDSERLGGIVETLERSLPVNRKGQRGLDRPRRRAPALRVLQGSDAPQRMWLLFAHDRAGGSGALPVTGRRPQKWHYEALIQPERPVRVLVSPLGAFTQAGLFAIPRGIAFARLRLAAREHPPGALLHLENVCRFEREFRGWMRRFRGVGSSYLANYIRWYRCLDSLESPASRLLLEAVRGSVPAPALPAGDSDPTPRFCPAPNTYEGHSPRVEKGHTGCSPLSPASVATSRP